MLIFLEKCIRIYRLVYLYLLTITHSLSIIVKYLELVDMYVLVNVTLLN